MSPALLTAAVQAGRTLLELRWEDGTCGEFAAIWLRDNRPEDRDPYSDQRLIDITDLPADPRLRGALVAGEVLEVSWMDDAPITRFASGWLYQHARARPPGAAPALRPWLDGSVLDARTDFAWASWRAFESDPRAQLQWLRRLLEDGLAFLSGVPCEDSGILEAMRPVGRIAETNYGLVFDVRTVPQPENLAYSDLGLGLHTDNPYREPVPGFQALHTLLASPAGGDSLFADGFALAEHLRRQWPDAFDCLTSTPVPFTYRSRSAELAADRPFIALDCSGRVAAVHYNSRSIAPLQLPADRCAAFYAAYRRFAGLLREPRFQLRTHLGDGDLALFDNQRILHGRTAFASAAHARHLRGCYLTRDSVHSAYALLQR